MVATLGEVIDKFGTPASILSDNGRCFNGGRSKKSMPGGRGSRWPEAELLEWLHGSMGREIRYHESLAAYVKYYNERRLHFGLDIANRRTPIMAFSAKTATDAIRKSDPRWMERDINE